MFEALDAAKEIKVNDKHPGWSMVSPSTRRQKSTPLDLCPYALDFEAIDAANDVKVNLKDPGPCCTLLRAVHVKSLHTMTDKKRFEVSSRYLYS